MTSAPPSSHEEARRPLHFFWLVDHSGSMQGARIAALNSAIGAAIPELCAAVAGAPEVEVLMRAIRFSTLAEWHVGPVPVALEQFSWPQLDTDTLTNTGLALELVAAELDVSKMPMRGFPPVILLISDGYATDPARYRAALQNLNRIPWGQRAVRIAIGIGRDSELNKEELGAFNNIAGMPELCVRSETELARMIQWVSVAATRASLKRKIDLDDDMV